MPRIDVSAPEATPKPPAGPAMVPATASSAPIEPVKPKKQLPPALVAANQRKREAAAAQTPVDPVLLRLREAQKERNEAESAAKAEERARIAADPVREAPTSVLRPPSTDYWLEIGVPMGPPLRVKYANRLHRDLGRDQIYSLHDRGIAIPVTLKVEPPVLVLTPVWVRPVNGNVTPLPSEGPFRLEVGLPGGPIVVAFETVELRDKGYYHIQKRHVRGARLECIGGPLDVYRAAWARCVE